MAVVRLLLSAYSVLYLSTLCSGQEIVYGFTGATGRTGASGSYGNVGPVGPAGPAGPTGPRGVPGFNGRTGASGPSGRGGGPSGGTGYTGSTGQRGEHGPPGMSGMEGPPGPPGAPGPAGLIIEAFPVQENAVLGVPQPPPPGCVRTLLHISLGTHVTVAIAALLIFVWQHKRVSNLYKKM